jgi:hypothetical protein
MGLAIGVLSFWIGGVLAWIVLSIVLYAPQLVRDQLLFALGFRANYIGGLLIAAHTRRCPVGWHPVLPGDEYHICTRRIHVDCSIVFAPAVGVHPWASVFG